MGLPVYFYQLVSILARCHLRLHSSFFYLTQNGSLSLVGAPTKSFILKYFLNSNLFYMPKFLIVIDLKFLSWSVLIDSIIKLISTYSLHKIIIFGFNFSQEWPPFYPLSFGFNVTGVATNLFVVGSRTQRLTGVEGWNAKNYLGLSDNIVLIGSNKISNPDIPPPPAHTDRVDWAGKSFTGEGSPSFKKLEKTVWRPKGRQLSDMHLFV